MSLRVHTAVESYCNGILSLVDSFWLRIRRSRASVVEITAHEDVLLTVEGYRSGNYTTRRCTTPRSKATVVEITALEGVLLPVDASGRDGRGVS